MIECMHVKNVMRKKRESLITFKSSFFFLLMLGARLVCVPRELWLAHTLRPWAFRRFDYNFNFTIF